MKFLRAREIDYITEKSENLFLVIYDNFYIKKHGYICIKEILEEKTRLGEHTYEQ